MLKFNPTVAVLPEHKVSRDNTETLAKLSTFNPQCQCQFPSVWPESSVIKTETS